MQHEELEEREFLCRQLDLLAGAMHATRPEIHLEVGYAHHPRDERRLAARQGPHSRHELPKREGLRDIIICTHFQPVHTIVDGVARREHEDGRCEALAAELATEIETGATGQHHVQHDHVERRACGFVAALRQGCRPRDVNALLAKACLEDRCKLRIVLDEEKPDAPNLQAEPLRSRGGGRLAAHDPCTCCATWVLSDPPSGAWSSSSPFSSSPSSPTPAVTAGPDRHAGR